MLKWFALMLNKLKHFRYKYGKLNCTSTKQMISHFPKVSCAIATNLLMMLTSSGQCVPIHKTNTLHSIH